MRLLGAVATFIAFAVLNYTMHGAGGSLLAASAAFSASPSTPSTAPTAPRRRGARSASKVHKRRRRAYEMGFIPYPPDRRQRGMQLQHASGQPVKHDRDKPQNCSTDSELDDTAAQQPQLAYVKEQGKYQGANCDEAIEKHIKKYVKCESLDQLTTDLLGTLTKTIEDISIQIVDMVVTSLQKNSTEYIKELAVLTQRVEAMEAAQVQRPQDDGVVRNRLPGRELDQGDKHDVLLQMFEKQKHNMNKFTKLVEETGLIKESAFVTFADLDIRDAEWREDLAQIMHQTKNCEQTREEASSAACTAPTTSCASSPSTAALYYDTLLASFQDEECINQFNNILDDQLVGSLELRPSSGGSSSPHFAASSKSSTPMSPSVASPAASTGSPPYSSSAVSSTVSSECRFATLRR
ncbi:unnamed protein product [Prorocentrum cordatum]|uniref:Uncharacterized protein n=1 Tax=Prorocentrum cordatum TaxID=2364126 RepID=A0ABN9QV52_9DINO|nr:unnamed protein product [Polarella glacialis]